MFNRKSISEREIAAIFGSEFLKTQNGPSVMIFYFISLHNRSEFESSEIMKSLSLKCQSFGFDLSSNILEVSFFPKIGECFKNLSRLEN